MKILENICKKLESDIKNLAYFRFQTAAILSAFQGSSADFVPLGL